MVIDLASFFSFDEILGFAAKKEQEEEEKSKATIHPKNQAVAQHAPIPDKIKEQKLELFFLQHPKLLENVQKLKKILAVKKAKQKKDQSDLKQKMPLLSYYFNNITDMCIQLITKSDLSREKKLKFRVAIKKLAWNYLEDVEDELVVPIDIYFEQLIDILQS
jgi:hypothetical protein